MLFQIQYFRAGALLCETPLEKPLTEAREFAGLALTAIPLNMPRYWTRPAT
jgi:hypothetical protein